MINMNSQGRFLALYTLLLLLFSKTIVAQQHDRIADSLKIVLAKSKEDTNKVNLLIELGNTVSYYDLVAAEKYMTDGIALSKKLKYEEGVGRCSYILGFVYMDLSNYPAAWQQLQEAEAVAVKLGLTDLLAKVNNAKGGWYYMQSDMFNASYHYSKATTLFQQLKDTVREITVFQNLISTLNETKSYQRSIKLNLQLIEKLKGTPDITQLSHAYNHLMIAYVGNKEINKAEQLIPLLRSCINQSIDAAGIADAYYVIGDVYLQSNRYDSAITYFNKAKEIAFKENYQPAYFTVGLGTAYLQKKDLTNAGKYLNEALALAKKSNTRDVYLKAYLPLSEYYFQLNNPVKAYEYLKEYNNLYDSVLTDQTRQYASYLESMNETQKKEKEITALTLSNTEKEITVVKRNRLLIIGGISSLSLLLLLGLLYRNIQQKQLITNNHNIFQEAQIKFLERQQQVISLQSMVNGQETERSRIAKDLHDGLGGLFSTIKMYFSTLQHDEPHLKTSLLFSKSYELIDTASEEVRRIAHNMMPEVLMKLGLIPSIQDMCNNITAGKLLKVKLQSYGMERRLGASTEIMLYRIVQELLNNIIKHAQASEVIVQFNKAPERLTVTIEDNGRGFDLLENEGKKNAGLETIKSRVNYLNGNISIESSKDMGTTIMMDFLINEEA